MSSNPSGEALFVVDMQSCYLKFYKDQKYVLNIIENVNKAVRSALSAGSPVFYVEHEYSSLFMRLVSKLFFQGAGLKTGLGFETDVRIQKTIGAMTYQKTKGDLFSIPEVLPTLKALKVSKVNLVGQDGIACIKDSALGGRHRGFHVAVADDCVATSSLQKWEKEKIKLKSAGVELRKQLD